jgi:hypothetical protein
MAEISRQYGNGQRREIHGQVIPLSVLPGNFKEGRFDEFAEQEKRKHIKNQVPEICMYQAACNKAVPLIPVRNSRRIENKIINDFLVVKTSQ